MRDVTLLSDDDLATMTEEERAAYYKANEDRLDEIFGGEPVRFFFDPDRTMTSRDGLVMSLREAATYEAKQAWSKSHPDDTVLGLPTKEPVTV